MTFLQYLLLAMILLAVILLYMRLARHLDIMDHPGERRSHSHPVVRGGGIVFLTAAVIWFFLVGGDQPWAIAGLVLVGLVSFVDDVNSLRGSIRLMVHLLAVILLFIQMDLFDIYWYWVLAAFFLTIGCINAFNFMDGINGITAFYSLVLLGTFSLLNNATHRLAPFFPGGLPEDWQPFFPAGLVGTVFISVLLFAFFNVRRKAVAFAGDVGSISLAFLLSWLMIELMVFSRQFFWILLFSVYGIETASTILIRLRRGENIFEPHRSHLFQILVNEKGWPHLKVAALYGGFQLVINLLTIWLIFTGRMNWGVFVLMGLCLTAIYWLARRRVMATVPGRNH